MSTMPSVRHKTARSLIMLLCAVPVVCAVPMAKPSLAQAVPTQPSAAPVPVPRTAIPAPVVPAPVPLKTPLPPVAASPTPDAARPVEVAPSATAVTPAKPGEPAAGAEPKSTPKTGPGVNEGGEAATSLRTTKLTLISLIDRSVTGKDKREIGHVIDVLVDAKGQPAALVVDVGGFMGVGNRRIAIAWERFALAGRKARDALQLQLSDAQVKAAPAYDGSDEVTVVQDAIEPPANPAAGHADLGSSRVDLGEGLADPGADSGDSNAVPQADPLNPD